jgi:hypothetical protein
MENKSVKDLLRESKQRLAERVGQIQSSDLPKSSAPRPDARPSSAINFSSFKSSRTTLPAVTSSPPAANIGHVPTTQAATAHVAGGSPAKNAARRDPSDVEGCLSDMERGVAKFKNENLRFWSKTDEDIKLVQDKMYKV